MNTNTNTVTLEMNRVIAELNAKCTNRNTARFVVRKTNFFARELAKRAFLAKEAFAAIKRMYKKQLETLPAGTTHFERAFDVALPAAEFLKLANVYAQSAPGLSITAIEAVGELVTKVMVTVDVEEVLPETL